MPISSHFIFIPLLTLAICLVSGIADADSRGLKVVDDVDLEQYAGTWYEIARLPNKHEKELVEVTSTFKQSQDGSFQVISRGYKGSRGGKCTTLKGNVEIPNPTKKGDLKVKVLIFSVGYKILDVDKENYRYAMITSDNSKKYLWIMSKSPVMDRNTYESLVESARGKGFNVDRLEIVQQFSNSAVAER